MKHISIPSRLSLNSLSMRLSIVTFVLCTVAGLIAAYFMLNSEREKLIANEMRMMASTSTRYTLQFEQLIKEKVSLAKSANQVVTKAITAARESHRVSLQAQSNAQLDLQQAPQSAPQQLASLTKGLYALLDIESSQLPAASDQSVRVDDGGSGAFIPSARLNADNRYLFPLTGYLWETLAPVIIDSFFNFYFISEDDFIRISPKEWALKVPADHHFANDLFYAIATPISNPSREPVWTPVYFDEIYRKWMTSLIIPVYIGPEFIGVTGSDFVLDELFSTFDEMAELENGRNAFLFDSHGNVLAHPQLMDEILRRAGDSQARLMTGELLSEDIHALMAQMIHTHTNELVDSYQDKGVDYVINMRPINGMGWYLAVYNSEQNVLAYYHNLKTKLIVIFILVAFLVSLMLQQVVYQLGLKRLRRLMQAVKHLTQGRWHFDLKDNKNDEISALSDAFSDMTTEINKLIVGLNEKIDEKEVAEQSANKLSKAVSFSGSGILITNKALEIEYVNPKLCEMSGLEASFFIDKPLFSMISHEMEFLSDDIKEDLQARNHWRGDILLINQGQKQLWASLSISPIWQEDNITNYVCSAQDISFVKESQRKMEQLAYFDVLTGLANRTFFKMQLRKALALSKRGHYSFALFYFDLDEFKRINDTLGHDAGDQLLIEVADRLQQRLRHEDTIARLGGDEFAVLLSGIKDKAEAQNIIEAIETMLTLPIKLGNNEVIVSASIGVTLAPFDSMEEDTLLKHADLAMYQAKEMGKNTSHFYTKDLDLAAKERMLIENELRIAIKEEQLLLYYQPQIDTQIEGHYKVVGFEALIRWNHPTKGMISPERFISVAETTGQIVEIGEWVLRESCRFLADLQRTGYDGKLSVNISSRQLKDVNLYNLILDIIQQTHIIPEKLDLEITESMLMGDVEGAIKQLYEFKKLGVGLSIDDFGTGYSSLSYLKRFPVDTLKIDRSFIKDIPDDRDDMAISSAIIAMAQKLNLNLVAEGVETERQIEFLRKNSCFVIQGYFFSKPLPEHAVRAFLAAFTTPETNPAAD